MGAPHGYMEATYCADDKHAWREVRSRNCQIDGNWFVFKGCRHCPATLETIISHEKTPSGDIQPKVRVFLLTGLGAQTTTKEAVVVAVQQPVRVAQIRG